MTSKFEIKNSMQKEISYENEQFPISIRTEIFTRGGKDRTLAHWHDEMEYIHILEGKMEYMIDGKKITLKKDDCLFINCRHIHESLLASKKSRFRILLFNPLQFSDASSIFAGYSRPITESPSFSYQIIHPLNPYHFELTSLIRLIEQTYVEGGPQYELDIASDMYQLLKYTFRLYSTFQLSESQENRSDLVTLQKMTSYIYRHYAESMTLEEISSVGSVSISTACRLFAKYLSHSPIDFLNLYRLQISCSLLKNTSSTISEISILCGFTQQSYYTRLFKRVYACTPMQYRKGSNPLPGHFN